MTFGEIYREMARIGKLKDQKKDKEDDVINQPKHYTSGKIQPIDVIEDWNLDFRLASALKYIARAGKKDPSKIKQDLEKAIWYIKRFISKEC